MTFFGLFKKEKIPGAPLPPSSEEGFPLPEQAKQMRESVQMPDEDMGGEMYSEHEASGPLFVKAVEYKHVLENTRMINHNIVLAEEGVERLHSLHDQKEKLYLKWHAFTKEVEEKLLYIDGELFGR